MLRDGVHAFAWWQLIAIVIMAAIAIAVGRLIALVTTHLVRKLASKSPWGARLLQRLRRPASMAWALVVFWLALPLIDLDPKALDLTDRVLRALAYLAFFWGLLRSVSIARDEIEGSDWASTRPNVRSVTDVGVKLAKVFVAAFALMVALSQLGYSVTAFIAGLGVGGVALALAAQKTVENLFGSISILADQPFRIGDTIRVDTIEGAVETIGLRSTRLRTLAGTLIIIPNGKLADMRIESLGPRVRSLFATKVSLARTTTIAQLQATLEGVQKRLVAHESVYKNDASVRLDALGDWSFDIAVSAPILTVNSAELAKIREDLLLECVRAVEEAGARLAVPARHIVMSETQPQ